MKQIVGCGCNQCKRGLHSGGKDNSQRWAWRKIRRSWRQLGKLVSKLSRGYTD